MKKTIAILLAILMISMAFAGCSERDAQTDDPNQDNSESQVEPEVPEGERPSLEMAAANNALKDESEITLVQFVEPANDEEVAVIKTNKGSMLVALYPEQAPQAVENFITLANDGFYNGKVFHFVQDGYLAQTGAINSNGTGSKSSFTNAAGDPVPFEIETSWDLWHFRGALSMVSNAEGLNGSQFAIIQSDRIYGYDPEDLQEAGFPAKVIDMYEQEGGVPHRDTYDTVFGMVVYGLETLDAITSAPVDASGVPEEPIIIESITFEKYGDAEIELPQDDEDGEE